MENEKVSEKAVLDYDGYKSVRSMLLSESKADRDVGLGILQSIDEKKCLPFILFTAIEFSQMDEHILYIVSIILSCRKPYVAIVIQKYLKWIPVGNQYPHSNIEFSIKY
jgi:hypothetical protein